jgi:hypothetical protein
LVCGSAGIVMASGGALAPTALLFLSIDGRPS